MDSTFGAEMLKKFGWSEGKGLGKMENGVSKFTTPTQQTVQSGIGNSQNNFTEWWASLYNETAKSVKVHSKNSGSIVKRKSKKKKSKVKE
jgi:G-patch domain